MKQPKVKLGYITYVKWLDSASDYGWQTETGKTHLTVVSAGIAVYSNKDFIQLTTSQALNGNVVSPISIPWCCITDFKQYGQIIVHKEE